jgi:hypothetical protein
MFSNINVFLFLVEIEFHYNKRCPCMPSDFTGFWVNSLAIMNKDHWRSSEFTSLMYRDKWTTPTFFNNIWTIIYSFHFCQLEIFHIMIFNVTITFTYKINNIYITYSFCKRYRNVHPFNLNKINLQLYSIDTNKIVINYICTQWWFSK